MSSTGGKKFTGTALIFLALFGVGGAWVDKMRNSGDEATAAETIPVAKSQRGTETDLVLQKPGFEEINLASDGTGTIVGKAVPGTKIILDIDGKSVQTGQVTEHGDFWLEQQKPLTYGKHVLSLKSVDPKDGIATASDHTIEVKLNKGRENKVSLLESGQAPQVLQGIDEKPTDGLSSKKVAETNKSKSTAKRKISSNSPTKKMAQSAVKPAKKTVAKRDITFREMKYVATDDKSGTIIVRGKSQAGANLRLMVDGKFIGKAIADKKGHWSVITKRNLTRGAHWLVAEQLDSNGDRIAHAESPFDRADEPVTMAGSEPLRQSDEKPALKMSMSPSQERTKKSSVGSPATDGDEAVSPLKNEEGLASSATSKKMIASNREPEQINRGKDQQPKDQKSIWDKFAGIFEVDPVKNGAASKQSKTSTDKADEGVAIVARQKQKIEHETKRVASSSSFAFESLIFKENAKSGALELSGYAEAGNRIRLFMGRQKIGEVVTNNQGRWSFTRKGAIKPGKYLFRAAQVLKSGRITSEVRMPYDHIAPIVLAEEKGSDKKDRSYRRASSGSKDIGSGVAVLEKVARVQKRDKRRKSVRKTVRVRKATRRNRKTKTASRRLRRAPTRSRIRKKKSHARRYVKRAKRRSAGKIRHAKSVARYYLNPRNKARYMAKRKRYPRSRRVPARLRVQKGTTLWGYSKHYYGRGHLYPHIRRANRRKIRNSNKIFVGQRIRILKLRRKR